MRHIRKQNEPRSLTEFRAALRNDPNFGYGLISAQLGREIRESLVSEQGGLCAYTGRHIHVNSCHIEHLKPQTHCHNFEDVAYSNMVACVPAPNDAPLPYGAHKKGSWPDATQAHLFVSPLQEGCTQRFSFTLQGKIKPVSASDRAAAETVHRLRLDHDLLDEMRKAAIEGTLSEMNRGPAALDAKKARKRIATLVAAEQNNQMLEPFCFVLQQALAKHIKRLEAIRTSLKEKN